VAGVIPGRLTTRRRIHRKYQSPGSTGWLGDR
jgi:hypothetical protein